jgi:hypothetical protein
MNTKLSSPHTSMNRPRLFFAITLVDNGSKILVCGGRGSDGVYESVGRVILKEVLIKIVLI